MIQSKVSVNHWDCPKMFGHGKLIKLKSERVKKKYNVESNPCETERI